MDELEACKAANIRIFLAAGNSAPNNRLIQQYLKSMSQDKKLIATIWKERGLVTLVGSYNCKDGKISEFSLAEPDIYAHGENLISFLTQNPSFCFKHEALNKNFAVCSGTSQATAVATGYYLLQIWEGNFGENSIVPMPRFIPAPPPGVEPVCPLDKDLARQWMQALSLAPEPFQKIFNLKGEFQDVEILLRGDFRPFRNLMGKKEYAAIEQLQDEFKYSLKSQTTVVPFFNSPISPSLLLSQNNNDNILFNNSNMIGNPFIFNNNNNNPMIFHNNNFNNFSPNFPLLDGSSLFSPVGSIDTNSNHSGEEKKFSPFALHTPIIPPFQPFPPIQLTSPLSPISIVKESLAKYFHNNRNIYQGIYFVDILDGFFLYEKSEKRKTEISPVSLRILSKYWRDVGGSDFTRVPGAVNQEQCLKMEMKKFYPFGYIESSDESSKTLFFSELLHILGEQKSSLKNSTQVWNMLMNLCTQVSIKLQDASLSEQLALLKIGTNSNNGTNKVRENRMEDEYKHESPQIKKPREDNHSSSSDMVGNFMGSQLGSDQ
jgi:hypothetical protein